MNKLKFIGFIFCLLLLASCKSESYAKKRKAEQQKFSEYTENRNLVFSRDSAYCFSLPTLCFNLKGQNRETERETFGRVNEYELSREF